MADEDAGNTRGRPFEKGESGNPSGRPRGARNRATLAAEALLDGEAEALTRKAVEMALAGDINAMRLCLDRILPPRRQQTLEIELSPLEEVYHARWVVAEIIAAVANGEITLSEAAELTKLVDMYVRACEASDRSSEAERQSKWAEEDRRDRKNMELRGFGMGR